LQRLSKFCATSIAALFLGLPSHAEDWSGVYAGASAGAVNGDWSFFDSFDDPTVNGSYSSARVVGAFLGYNMQQGNLVYGAELALSRANDLCFAQFPAECSDNLIDLKARVGYSVGPALIFGVIGVPRLEYDFSGVIYPLTGLTYGLGIDYILKNNIFIGAEALRRDTENQEFGNSSTQQDFTSLTLRLGLKF